MRAFLAILALFIGLLPNRTALAGEVQVAVAANFRPCLDELVPLFQGQTGHSVHLSVGSTGRHHAQIVAGAPFDVFLAADTRRPALLESSGLTVPGSRFTYARGRLALWAPGLRMSPDATLTTLLGDPDLVRLALANPRHAPYGQAAQQALVALDRWDILAPRLVQGQSVGQTWQFAASGNAQAAFVALAQLDEASRRQAIMVPETLHDPIDQQVVLLVRGSENPAARALIQFLRSDAARCVIRDRGYALPALEDF